MAELRIAKTLLHKVTLYAEQHAINRVAPNSEATQVGGSTKASRDDSSPALRIIKLQVCGLQLGVSSSRSSLMVLYPVHQRCNFRPGCAGMLCYS